MNQPHKNSDLQNRNPKERGTEEVPFFVKIVPSDLSPEAKRKEEEKEKTDRALADYTSYLFFATAFLAVATFGLAIVAYRQMREARDSIDAAKRAADTAERALTVVERAFVAVGNLSISTIVYPGPNNTQMIAAFIIHVNVINSGRTPARRYMNNINVVVMDRIPANFRYPDRNTKDIAEGVVGPQTQTFFIAELAIQDAVAVFKKEREAIVYGWIEYDDIFRDSIRHRTEFCFNISTPLGDPWIPLRAEGPRQPTQLGFPVYGAYNATDEDCRYKPGETPVAEPGELPEITQPPQNPFPQSQAV